MTRKCDHTSVGLLVWRDDRLLMIERRTPPFGFASPAGHVDDHGSFEDAARAELEEEVGLIATKLQLKSEGRKDNPCRRKGGTWHYWKIYEAMAQGPISISPRETKQAGWHDSSSLMEFGSKTEQYRDGLINEEQWQRSPGLEPVWYDWFKCLDLL